MWEFHSFYDGIIHRWSWRRYSGATLDFETRPSFRSIAEAVHDAHRHGFQMYRDRWQICTLSR